MRRSVANVSAKFADLRAQIDPLGADTSYYFEYGPTTAYGSDTPALTPEAPYGVSIGSGGLTGGAVESVLRHVGPLTAGGTYHFRVVAESEIEGRAEVVYGPDGVFTTLPLSGEGLADGRAYELLTPPDKGSAEDMFADPESEPGEYKNANTVGYPSESGEEFILETKAAFGSSCGAGSSFAASATNVYVFRRDPVAGCWQMTALASRALGVQNIGLDAFDPDDLARVGIFDTDGSEASAGGTHGLSLLGPAGGPYAELHNEVETEGSKVIEEEGTKIVGGSRDLSHVVLESLDHTLVGRVPGLAQQDAGSHALYEWADGEFSLASVGPRKTSFRCGAVLGQSHGIFETRYDAVSADGSRIVLTAPDPYAVGDGPGCWGGSANPPCGELQFKCVLVDERWRCPSPKTARSIRRALVWKQGVIRAVYVGASESDTKVFFVSDGELTEKEAVELKLEDPELYECEVSEVPGRTDVQADADLGGGSGQSRARAGQHRCAGVDGARGRRGWLGGVLHGVRGARAGSIHVESRTSGLGKSLPVRHRNGQHDVCCSGQRAGLSKQRSGRVGELRTYGYRRGWRRARQTRELVHDPGRSLPDLRRAQRTGGLQQA